MTNVFEGEPDARQSSSQTEKVSRFRPRYRALSTEEKDLHDAIKERAADLEELFGQLRPSREVSLALTKLEESIMWAVKGLTSNPE